MNKRKVKIIVVAFVAVVLTAVLFAVGMAENVTDGMFNMNTPTKITKNSTIVGTINSKKEMIKKEFNQHTQCLMEEKYQNDTCIND